MIRLVATTLALCVSFTFAPARTWQIYPDGTGDAPTIQEGIDSAAVGDTVLLHDGTYTGTGNKNLDFQGKDLVLKSVNGPAATILNCEYSGRGVFLHSGETQAARIEGITIRNGHRLTGEAPYGGGGIRIDRASPWIDNCVIERCKGDTVTGYGGGMLIIGQSLTVLSGCAFYENSARFGGGISWRDISNSWIEMRDCEIRGNRAEQGGGINGTDHVYLVGCCVSGNRAHDKGGAVFLWPLDSGATNGHVDSCTITGNIAGSEGGGIYVDGGDVGFLLYINSILWGNDAPVGAQLKYVHMGETIFGCSCVDPGGVSSSGANTYQDCIQEDPIFCAPEPPANAPTLAGDYTLDAASPCMNAPVCGRIGSSGQGCDIYTSIADAGSLPARAFGLFVSPNPSSGEVTLRYSLPSAVSSTIRVYDIRGRVIRSLTPHGPEGRLQWDGMTRAGDPAAPGVYFVRMTDGTYTTTKRVMMVR